MDNDISNHVKEYIKVKYPKVYSHPALNGVNELGEEFKSKQQQKYFYAKANDDSLPNKEKSKWKKWASEYSDETDFDKIPQKVEEEELDEFVNGLGASISGDERMLIIVKLKHHHKTQLINLHKPQFNLIDIYIM